ncbi:LysE family translocator [Mariluticola halotolerans]|uniref:LysE family translocator n=1 Tax=Mariluticola halotolerans TaxID=2909283 RepID=UPI0026E187B6|nr:LysE family translocator [Mariluticola halotolerans]UJQ93607.1 LysE family translocator [Mariluticola halotolerans]
MQAFIPDLSILLAFAAASIVLAITPGPDMALFISRTVNYGRAHGIAAVLGASTGLFVHIGLAAFGISLLLATAPTAFFALKIAGALYLLWLAIQAIRQGGGITLTKKARRQPSVWQSYLTGVGINLTNPKVILFFVTFLPQFVSHDDPAAAVKLLFLGGEFILLSIPIVIAIVWGAEWVAGLLTRSVVAQRALNWSFAAVFAGFAAAILTIEARH